MFGRHRGVAVRSLTNIYSLVETILDVSTKILEHGGEYLSVANGAILHVYCVQSRVEGLLKKYPVINVGQDVCMLPGKQIH